MSKLIHQFSIIVYDDGRLESSERLYGTPNANSIYHKESGNLEPGKLAELRSLIQGYAVIAKAVEDFVSSNDVDPFEHESRDRRGLGFFADSEDRGISTWMLNYFSSHFERPEVQKKFDEIWILLANIPDFRRFEFDEGFTCPAYTQSTQGRTIHCIEVAGRPPGLLETLLAATR